VNCENIDCREEWTSRTLGWNLVEVLSSRTSLGISLTEDMGGASSSARFCLCLVGKSDRIVVAHNQHPPCALEHGLHAKVWCSSSSQNLVQLGFCLNNGCLIDALVALWRALRHDLSIRPHNGTQFRTVLCVAD